MKGKKYRYKGESLTVGEWAKRIGVSPAVVMISVLFWGWVLGPVGMLFAVPLTMAVRGTLVSRRPVATEGHAA